MNVVELPLTADNQHFTTTINNVMYQMTILWRNLFWTLDLADSSGNTIIAGIPLITGADLLQQYQSLNLGFSLRVHCDIAGQDNPTEYDLGTYSHLYILTE